MKTSIDAQIDGLYKLPLEEFTKARNALAKTLSGSDRTRVASLVKPSLPMWLVNQLYWQDAAAYHALVDASEKLRAAHRAALGGKKIDTQKADALHRATVDKAFAKSLAAAQKRGLRVTDTVRDALRRTLAALPTGEPAGRLTREPPPAGFSLLAGIAPRPIQEERKAPTAAEVRRQREAERQARQAEEKARRERERRERDIRKAEEALRAAERRLAALKG